jgi:hypothetical protein
VAQFGVTNDKQLRKSYRECVLLPSKDSILRNTRNPNQYTARCYTHGKKGGEMKYKKPEELSLLQLLQAMNGMQRHYKKKGWDINKSSKYSLYMKHLIENYNA